MSSSAPGADGGSRVGFAKYVIETLRHEGLLCYLFGSVAVMLRCSPFYQKPTQRGSPDIDIFSPKLDRIKFESLCVRSGWRIKLKTSHRYGFFYEINCESVSLLHVYCGHLAFNHEIPCNRRLTESDLTIPLTDLLLSKLQIHQPRVEDIWDILFLLSAFNVCSEEERCISAPVLATLCRTDWGLYTDCRDNLIRVTDELRSTSAPLIEKEPVLTRTNQILEAIERIPKPITWRLRSIIGRRVRYWYRVEELN